MTRAIADIETSGGDFWCTDHYPEAVALKRITPSLVVLYCQSSYALVVDNVGCGKTLLEFNEAPAPDPVTPEIEARTDATLESGAADTEEDEVALRLSIEWGEVARNAMVGLIPDSWGIEGTRDFFEDIRTNSTWSREDDGMVEMWLYNEIAKSATVHQASLTA